MPDPVFLSLAEVEYLHAESLARWGGLAGVGNPGLVDSALASAINSWHYGSADLAKNGLPVLVDNGTIYEALIAVARKQMDKSGLAEVFRRLSARN